MITKDELIELLGRVKYREWVWKIREVADEGWLLHGVFLAGDDTYQQTRKWYVSRHSVGSEIVQTCLKAVLTGLEHEAREEFTFDGHAVYGPHHDVKALIGIAHETRSYDR